jgi:hypothetical protein
MKTRIPWGLPCLEIQAQRIFSPHGDRMGKKSRENVGWDGDHTLGQAPILKKFNKILFFCWLIDEMAKPLKTLTLKVE